ncbi:MAG TPA: methyltransferase domain-containing protein [Steroidobacteraceae bacterium]|jgi:trans-aconitate 2-methyltransferase|nr:methyltransferase domain-containing protein [Steroidobacteraceae bacterium]
MTWDPQQYLRFSNARTRPAIDLLNRIETADPRVVYDLGCGAGNITLLLRERWPNARIIGLDDSQEMLAQAAKRSKAIEWSLQSVAAWRPADPADVIFSNAALHWLPNHSSLLPRLAGGLNPNGTLAVQMPRNFAAPSHTAITETVLDGPWREQLEPLINASPVARPEDYFDYLQEHAATIDIWETEYLHVLEGEDPVKEWTKGTWLKRFLDALDEPERSEFERNYAQRLKLAYPARADGRTLFPFRRLFVVMRKK